MSTTEEKEGHYYFGYGTNMCLESLKGKIDIENVTFTRGILKDYKLVFNIGLKGDIDSMCNIVKSLGDEVHGSFYKLTEKQFKVMDIAEFTYQRKLVPIIPYQNKENITNCFVYYSTEEIIKKKKCDKKFRTIDDLSINTTKPCENYLFTLIKAAIDINLDINYINKLKQIPFNKTLTVSDLTKEEALEFYKKINGKTFTVSDITVTKGSENPLSYCNGIVFNIKDTFKFLVNKCGGNNMNLWMDTRYCYYDLYLQNKKEYKKELLKFCKGQLIHFRNKGVFGVIVGKLDDSLYGYSQFGWEQDFKQVIG